MWTQARSQSANSRPYKPRLWLRPQVKAVLLAALGGLSACSAFVSNDEFGMGWSGKPVDQLKTAWGQPSAEHKHWDGSTEISYEMTDIRCTYWFTVDRAGKIAAYRYAVGEWGSCKPS